MLVAVGAGGAWMAYRDGPFSYVMYTIDGAREGWDLGALLRLVTGERK